MRWAWVWLAMGCASQRSAESHADYVAEVQTTRTEGAERVIRTVEVFEAAAPRAGDGVVGGAHQPPPASQSGQPQLLRRTTTTIDRAPIITETHSGLDVKTDAESASSRSFLKLSLWTKLLLATGLLALALLAWRFRTGLASGVLRVLGRG